MIKEGIYKGQVSHHRLSPKEHKFKYNLPFFVFDIDHMEDMNNLIPFFSYNRKNIISIHDKDYMYGKDTIRNELITLLKGESFVDDIDKIFLLTNPKFFGYVFNPVSFYYCYDEAGNVLCHVAEVNNTFKERHFYVVKDKEPVKKIFHVSPFNDMEGSYDFYFNESNDRIIISITLNRNEKRHFQAVLTGRPHTYSISKLYQLTLPVLNYPRILREAIILFFNKKLKVFHKPIPELKRGLVVKRPTMLQRILMKPILGFFKKFYYGHIQLILPNRKVIMLGVETDKKPIRLYVNDWRFFSKVALRGDIGFGECYTDGYWSTDNLTGLLQTFIKNRKITNEHRLTRDKLSKKTDVFRHRLNKNTIHGSAKNIEAHYDLSNDFFRLWLDETMTYSSAVFSNRKEPLADAQYRKINLLLDRLDLKESEHLLEIGSGWGALAIQAASRFKCKVTTITLSKQQYAFVKEKIRSLNLQDKIEIKLMDYRNLDGQYDKIVSVEMIEAVGFEHFGQYFKTIESRLKKGGKAVIQAITIDHSRFEHYKFNADWIQTYIFPGGLVPSLEALSESVSENTNLKISNPKFYGMDYARTLRRWLINFNREWHTISQLGFDQHFKNMWNYYLCYCEAGFREKTIDLVQFELVSKKKGAYI